MNAFRQAHGVAEPFVFRLIRHRISFIIDFECDLFDFTHFSGFIECYIAVEETDPVCAVHRSVDCRNLMEHTFAAFDANLRDTVFSERDVSVFSVCVLHSPIRSFSDHKSDFGGILANGDSEDGPVIRDAIRVNLAVFFTGAPRPQVPIRIISIRADILHLDITSRFPWIGERGCRFERSRQGRE